MAQKTKKKEKNISFLHNIAPKNSENLPKTNALEGLSIRNVQELLSRGMEPLTFTFEDFDREHEYFNLSRVGVEWFVLLLDTLKKLSNYPWTEILKMDYYHAHPHDWSKANARFKKAKYEQYEGVQFALGPKHGRVHGYVIGNVFFIVWLDRYHNLYDMEGQIPAKNKIKSLQEPAKSCIQIYDENLCNLYKLMEKYKSDKGRAEENLDLFLESYKEIENENEKLKAQLEELSLKAQGKLKKQEDYNKKLKRRQNAKKK